MSTLQTCATSIHEACDVYSVQRSYHMIKDL